MAGAWLLTLAGLVPNSLIDDRSGGDHAVTLIAADGPTLLGAVWLAAGARFAFTRARHEGRAWLIVTAVGALVMSASIAWELATEAAGVEASAYALFFVVGLITAAVGSVGLVLDLRAVRRRAARQTAGVERVGLP